MMRRPPIAVLLLPLLVSGCSGGWQSAIDPQGPRADDLASLFWGFTAVLGAVWLITMIVLAASLSPVGRSRTRALAVDPSMEQRMTVIIAAALALTGLIVMALTGFSYAGQKRSSTQLPETLSIKLTGHQWWWEARYEDAEPSRIFTTANEIHIPVGERVTFQLSSSDVIHSFWVPNLSGKLDLIPGVENKLQFVAGRAGAYRGQCAEFCGYQHAHMGLIVIAEPREDFDRWREAQIRSADPPSEDDRQKGQAVFLSKPCALCHTVRGTTAGGRVGPDLTHLGTRTQLASATLPLTRGTLSAWIIDPQGIKPGVHMPMTQLQPDEINPLLSFLVGLK